VTAPPSLPFTLAARGWRGVALALTLAGALAIAGTYLTFSNTNDEPAHIAAGMQWLAGNRGYDSQHPPLGRIAAAIGPYLHGDRAPPLGASSPTEEGTRLLGRSTHYRTTLALARLGELPFFFLLCVVVWAWGVRLTDERGGAVAVLLLVTNPNVLAHAGLATTDIALAATIAATLLAFVSWLDAPEWASALALGIALALAATSDFASLPMLALACPAVYSVRRRASGAPLWGDDARWRGWLAVTVTVVAGLVTWWAVYGFAVGPLVEGSAFVVPAPAWFHGLAAYFTEGTSAHPAYLFGERSMNGWWYYYPIALLVKTPLPLALLAILGAAAAMRDLVRRDDWEGAAPLVAGAALLLAAAITGDDSGVRFVLPVFALLPLLGAVAAVELWDHAVSSVPARRLVRLTVGATLGAAALVPMRAHPDYLAYFNPFAGDRPELVLVDSNLDWGQDLYRLGAVMKRMHIDSVSVAYYGSAKLDAAGVRNARLLAAAERPTGWIAASQTMLAGVGGDGAYEWLNELRPIGRIGSSMMLFYVAPPRKGHR
jgi:hypothetical protein